MAQGRSPLGSFALQGNRAAGGRPGPDARAQLRPFLGGLAKLGLAICALVVLGTVGFMITEDTSLGYGFLWTLDTVATVGSIPDPTNTGAHVVKVILIVLGVGTLFYALVTVTEFFVTGHLGALLQERRTLRAIDAMQDHLLICGFGRVGRQVARDARVAGRQYVVIDTTPESRDHAEAVGAAFVEGSPSDDDVLRDAGIDRAAAVLACVDNDADNIFITLTVRELRPDITIVARASKEDSEKKLRRAGADRVVSPYKASGVEMARLALHPQVTGVVDVAPEYRLEEIEVTAGCEAVGRTLADIRGASVIAALRRPDGSVVPQPGGDIVLRPGDVLVAMGETGALERLEGRLAPAAAA